MLKASLALGLCTSGLARAQTFTDKPVRLIVGASPGTVLDRTARFLSEPLQQRLGTPIVVENKVGAGGIIGVDFVARAPADGHTLLLSSIPIYTNRWLSETPLPYDPIADITPIARLNNAAVVLLVPTASPYNTLADLIADMRARPGEVTYASAGTGTAPHLAVSVLNDMTNTQARHIPYKGAAPAVTDTVSGQVAFTFQSASSALQLVKAGRLRALAVSGTERLKSLPDVPTVAEAGVNGYSVTAFVSVFGPSGIPPATVEKLSAVLLDIGRTEAFQQFCDEESVTLDLADTKSLSADAPKELELWRQIIEASKKT
ncbi:tripartite tricarboxylate transporter substrate binding protein [Alcaligenaceae bacterium]|nr:tripartite tricarboxylate transporter substrate binding protein [Alcaligenaceae bacterium]